MKADEIKKIVKSGCSRVALESISCCASPGGPDEIGRKTGYGEDELKSVPRGVDLGLVCGNPVALRSIKEGEVVLHLGSGAGFDVFLSANTKSFWRVLLCRNSRLRMQWLF